MSRIPLLFFVVLWYPLSVFSQNAELSGEFKKFHKITLTWSGEQASEEATTFKDYRLNVTFTSPSGKKYFVPGYFAADGNARETSAISGNKWRCHFNPLETGNWSYRTSFRTFDNIAASINPFLGAPVAPIDGDVGVFTIEETDKNGVDFRGKGKLEYVAEHYLRWSNNEYFLKLGTSSPEVFLEYIGFDNTPTNATPDFVERNYQAHIADWQNGNPAWKNENGKGIIGAVNYLSNQGINSHAFVIDNSYGDADTVYPWITKDEHYVYDVSKLDQWQIVFDHMVSKGLMVHFILSEAENQSVFELADDFEGNANFADARKIYYRELVARFGYLNAITWNIGEENGWERPNETFGRAITSNQQKSFADFLKELLYYNDNVVLQNGHAFDDSVFNDLIGINNYTGASLQGPANSIERSHVGVLKWRNNSAEANKKWVVSFDRPFDFGSIEPALFREKSLWASILAGAGGFEFNITAEERVVQDYSRFEGYWQHMKYLGDLFTSNNIPYQEMESKDELVSNGWCFGKDYEHYVIYLKNEGTTDIDILGDYSVKWFDPRNGGVLVDGTVTTISSGTNVNLGSPPNNTDLDWVVLLESLQTESEAVTGVILDPSETAIRQGLTFQLNAQVQPLNATNDEIVYSSSNAAVATVDANGLVTAISLGEATITATTVEGGFTANTVITVISGAESCSASGTILFQRYDDIVGSDINSLISSPDYPNNPTLTTELASFEIPENVADNYGAKVSGYICAPETGTYYFWISADDQAQLNLSTDNDPANAVTIAFQNAPSFGQEWNRFANQQSVGIELFLGETYYIEALMKENRFADHLAVGWRKPSDGIGSSPAEVIPGSVLAPDIAGTTPDPTKVIGLNVTPTETTLVVGETTTIQATVLADQALNKTVTWQSSDTAIATVDENGLVTAVSTGNVVVTAITEDGGYTAQTSITVMPPVRVTEITLDESEVILQIEETAVLNITVLPTNAANTAIIWSSSDITIATVDPSGLVTAVSEGNAIITATSEDGGFTATSNVTVTVPVTITEISIDPEEVILQIEETIALSIIVTPEEAAGPNVNWSSSDTSIATVDENGVVTAIAIGSVVITAATDDANHMATSMVTVAPPTLVTGIVVNPTELAMNIGNMAVLTVSISPDDATNTQVNWLSSDEGIVSVDENGLITAISLGNATITATTEDGGYAATSSITVTDQELIREGEFIIFPNPATDVLNVEMSKEESILKIEIYDAIGRMVLEVEKQDFEVNGTTLQLSVLPFQNSLYSIHILTDTLEIVKIKFVVLK